MTSRVGKSLQPERISESHHYRFRLQPTPPLLLDLFLDFILQCDDFRCRRSTQIHDEIGMLRRDLRAADAHSLEAGSIDQATGGIARRVLESAAEAALLDRLRGPPMFLNFQQASAYRGSAARQLASGSPNSFRTILVPRTIATIL